MKKIVSVLVLICFLSANVSAMDLSAVSAVLIDADSGRILYSKNPNQAMKPASTTKIMTGLIALTKSNPDDIVTVSALAASQEGSSMYLKAGEQISMRDLVYGLMLSSGNDAAVAVAEHISGSVEAFAELMTQTARDIGCKNTSFENPNGLDADGHYTTAYELALITREALKNPEFAKIVATREYAASGDKYFTNHNKLLSMYEGCTGVKTGYTKKSGRTLVSSATRDGLSLIAVTLNAPDDWNDHMNMFNMGFDSYRHNEIIKSGDEFGSISVSGGTVPVISAVYKGSVSATLTAEESERIEISCVCPDKVDAPVKIGQVLGEAVVCLDGTVIGKAEIIANEHSAKPVGKSIVKAFKRVVLEWLLMPRQNKMVV